MAPPSYEHSFSEHPQTPEGAASYEGSFEPDQNVGYDSRGGFSLVGEVNGKPFGAEDDSGLFGFSEESHVGSTNGLSSPHQRKCNLKNGFS